MRLELLRMRGAIARTELAGAVGEVRERTRPVRRLVGAVGQLRAVFSAGTGGAGGWLPFAASVAGQRPWIGLALAGAIRLVRRKPLAAIVTLGAVLLAARALRATTGRDQGPHVPEGQEGEEGQARQEHQEHRGRPDIEAPGAEVAEAPAP